MIPTILSDDLPRYITYPTTSSFLSRELKDIVDPDDVGIFFLYISGVQLDHYDPLISKATTYPILVLANEPPTLSGNVIAAMAQARPPPPKEEEELSGAARAEAQLRGQDRAFQTAANAPTNKEPQIQFPSVSILVLPVKTRIRHKVTPALETQGLRAIKNWMSCPPERKATQRPLVLLFDEESGRVTSKFAQDWNEPNRPRIYS